MTAAVGLSSGADQVLLGQQMEAVCVCVCVCVCVSYSATAGSAWSCPGCTRCRTAAGPIALPGRPAQTSWRPSLRLTATARPSHPFLPETHLHKWHFSQAWRTACSTDRLGPHARRSVYVGNVSQQAFVTWLLKVFSLSQLSAEITNTLTMKHQVSKPRQCLYYSAN